MMHPCYYGFTGEIIVGSKEDGKYSVIGKIERTNDTTLVISELPIGRWTQDHKTFLEEMMTGTDKAPSVISDFKENHTDTTVAFTITAAKENIDMSKIEGIYWENREAAQGQRHKRED